MMNREEGKLPVPEKNVRGRPKGSRNWPKPNQNIYFFNTLFKNLSIGEFSNLCDKIYPEYEEENLHIAKEGSDINFSLS